ncbi:MAG: RNA polymerase sigma factor [Phycisphaerae bacterium]
MTERRDEQSDEVAQLLCRLRRGERGAFERFYRITAPTLRQFINQRLPQAMRQDTDDLLQEVFIRIYGSTDNFREGGAGFAWLRGITRHVVCRHLRRRGPAMCDLAMVDNSLLNRTVSTPIGGVELLTQQIVALAARLPLRQRQAFQLVCIDGMPRPAAAVHLQCSLPQLRDRLREARKRLRTSLSATKSEMRRGGRLDPKNRFDTPRLAHSDAALQKKTAPHPTFAAQGGNSIYDTSSLSGRADRISHRAAGYLTALESPLMTTSQCIMRLSRHFRSCRLSDGRMWLFNTSRLNPIQLDGSDQEAEDLLSLLKMGRLNELPIDVVEMLHERGIVLESGIPDLSPEDVLNTVGPAREFRLSMSGRCRNLPGMQRGLEALAGYLRSCNPRYGRLRVTFECGDLAGGPLRNLVMPHVQWVSRFLPFGEGAMDFCVNLRWSYVAANVEAVRMCLAPSLRLNIVVDRAVTDKEIQDIGPLIKRWGFFPNIFVVLNRITSGCAQALLEKLREQWGDEFQYSLSIPLRVPDRPLASYQAMLPPDESIKSLLCFIEQHPPLARQNTWYAALKSQMSLYPADGRMADGVFVDGDGRFAPGMLIARRDPCRLADAEAFLSQLPLERTVRSQPLQPDRLNSRPLVAASEIKCEACPLKLWCGGICAIAGEPVKPIPIDLAVLELLCPARTSVMTRLLTEAISSVPLVPPATARFQCSKGRMSILSYPASSLKVGA